MQDMNNTPNTEQNRSSASADKWKELLETPEVMSSSGSPSSRDITTPADYPWDVESSSVPSSSSSKVSITWVNVDPFYSTDEGECLHTPIDTYVSEKTVYKDVRTRMWKCRVVLVLGSSLINIYTGGYRNADASLPTNAMEAVDAVIEMNNYLFVSRGRWHTPGASLVHENFHKTQWRDASEYYWEEMGLQAAIEAIGVSMDECSDEGSATRKIEAEIESLIKGFNTLVRAYKKRLPDLPGVDNNYPYRAGQAELNKTTRIIQMLAQSNHWVGVPTNVTEPGNYYPPCFLPPVSEKYGLRSHALMGVLECPPVEDNTADIHMSLVNPQDWRSQPLLVSFSNRGTKMTRLLDKVTPKLAWTVFFDVELIDLQGNVLMSSYAQSDVTFAKEPGYLNILPGESRNVAIPLHELIGEKCPGGLPAGEYTLTLSYFNKYGRDCLKGSLQVTENVLIE